MRNILVDMKKAHGGQVGAHGARVLLVPWPHPGTITHVPHMQLPDGAPHHPAFMAGGIVQQGGVRAPPFPFMPACSHSDARTHASRPPLPQDEGVKTCWQTLLKMCGNVYANPGGQAGENLSVLHVLASRQRAAVACQQRSTSLPL